MGEASPAVDPTRRDVLRTGAVGLAAVAVPTGVVAATLAPAWPLGVQLWSVKAEMERDLPGTLRRLARLGYRRVESAGLHGRGPGAFRRAVDAAGLRCDSAHVSMADLHADPARRIGEVRDAGADWLVCSSPLPARPLAAGMGWMRAMGEAMTADAWTRNAALLNEIAARAAKAGLKLGYHNHAFEFGRYGDRRGFDMLLADTDAALVKFELDVAWAAAGGVDPAALLRAHPGRFAFLHLKDLGRRPPVGRVADDFTTTEVGRGVLDWPGVFAAARAAGVGGAYVEQEAPYTRPVFASLAISRDYLRSLDRRRE